MSRIRTVKPEFWQNEALSALPEATHMLAGALLNYADDEGYFNANPVLVKAACFPLREPSVSVHDSLSELSRVGYLRLGINGDGKRYGHIVHFLNHQKINRPTPSRIKDLEVRWEGSVSTHGGLSEASSVITHGDLSEPAVSTHGGISEPSLPEGKGKEGNGEGKGTGGYLPPVKGREDNPLKPPLANGSAKAVPVAGLGGAPGTAKRNDGAPAGTIWIGQDDARWDAYLAVYRIDHEGKGPPTKVGPNGNLGWFFPPLSGGAK